MPYPDYSIVIITVTEGGQTVNMTKAFYEKALAEKYYKKALEDGFRAYYFERPIPTKFAGNNEQPLVQNVEKQLIAQPVQTPTIAGATGTPTTVKEDVLKATQFTVESAFGIIETVQTASFKTGEKVFEVLNNGLTSFRRFVGYEYSLAGTVAIDVTQSNKRVIIRHDGAGFFQTPVITKLWPDKDEYEDMPPEPITTVIEGDTVTLGLKTIRKTYDGTQFNPPTQTEFTLWVNAGVSILVKGETEYLSDGEGWYTSRPFNPNTNCDPDGYFYSQVSTTPIKKALSGYGSHLASMEVTVGDEYVEIVADGECSEEERTRNEYLPLGTVVYEDEQYWYKTAGPDLQGDIYREAKDQNPEPEDPEIDPVTGCKKAGIIINTEETDDQMTFGTDPQWGEYMYASTVTVQDEIHDGYCGTAFTPPRTEFKYQDGDFMGSKYLEGSEDALLIMTANSTGGFTIRVESTNSGSTGEDPEGQESEWDGSRSGDTNYEEPEFPETECNNPPKGEYRTTNAGRFVGSVCTSSDGNGINGSGYRHVQIPLDGVAAGWKIGASVTAATTKGITTGQRWKNRKISNGPKVNATDPCPEDDDEDNNASTCYSSPPNKVSFKSGTIAYWSYDGKPIPNNAGGFFSVYRERTTDTTSLRRWESKEIYGKHDGMGGVTWFNRSI